MKYVKLNELCDINIGKTPSRSNASYWGDDENWISISDMNKKYIEDTKEKITYKAIKECNMKLIPKGTVIMSFKLSIGKTAILKKDMYSNEAIANFPIKDEKELMNEYLYYALQVLNLTEKTDRAVMGATLNKAKLNTLVIPYAKIEKQKKIVEVLNKVKMIIDKRKKQLENLDELNKSQFTNLFGSMNNNIYEFEIMTLNDVAVGGLSYGSTAAAVAYDGITRYVRITDITDAGVLNEDIKSATKTDDKYLLNEGDILFARTGATVGKTFLYRKAYGRCIYAGFLIRLIPDITKVTPEYLFHFTKSDYYCNFVKSTQRVVAQPNINAKEYGKLNIIIPPLTIQKQFAYFVQQTDKQKFIIQQNLYKLQELFDSLMQQFFA